MAVMMQGIYWIAKFRAPPRGYCMYGAMGDRATLSAEAFVPTLLPTSDERKAVLSNVSD